METLTATSIRVLVTKINELGLHKENIVSIQHCDDQWYCLYFK